MMHMVPVNLALTDHEMCLKEKIKIQLKDS